MAVTLLLACAAALWHYAIPHRPKYPPLESIRSRPGVHVLLIAIDGLRPDALSPQRTPNIDRLIRNGSYTARATNILPSRTLPNHAGMLTGLDADGHGLLVNSYMGAARIEVPTVFDSARAAGLSTALYYGKRKMAIFEREGALQRAEHDDGPAAAAALARELEQVRWNLAALFLPEADDAGHTYGWMSPQYLDAVRRIDATLGLVFDAIDASPLAGKVHILLTADHGGTGTDHGDDIATNRTIPFLVFGPGVRKGAVLGADGRPVRNLDMAPTAAALLGLTLSGALVGRRLDEAFEPRRPPDVPSIVPDTRY